jgi:hypothetical protein
MVRVSPFKAFSLINLITSKCFGVNVIPSSFAIASAISGVQSFGFTR